jgi:hypothetical protein
VHDGAGHGEEGEGHVRRVRDLALLDGARERGAREVRVLPAVSTRNAWAGRSASPYRTSCRSGCRTTSSRHPRLSCTHAAEAPV